MKQGFATRGRSREEAAAYIGVGATKFDEMVADGRMPRPRQIDSRRVWCVHELDDAFDRLPVFGGDRMARGPESLWTDMAA